jgi:phosphate/sulfate permease
MEATAQGASPSISSDISGLRAVLTLPASIAIAFVLFVIMRQVF